MVNERHGWMWDEQRVSGPAGWPGQAAPQQPPHDYVCTAQDKGITTLLVVNPLWKTEGNLVSEFGILPWDRKKNEVGDQH